MVMVPVAKQALDVPVVAQWGSATDVATIVTVAVVGTEVGAVYNPFASTEPHVGLHVAKSGKVRLPDGVCWVRSHVTPLL